MITMLHYDAVRTPLPPEVATLTQSGPKKQPILTETQHLAYLQAHPYQQFTEEEMENVIKKYMYLLILQTSRKKKFIIMRTDFFFIYCIKYFFRRNKF